MDEPEAQNQLNLIRRAQHKSARHGALLATVAMASLVLAIAVVVDLEMIWLLGIVVLGFVGAAAARPLRLRLNWSDRFGICLLALTIVTTFGVYVLVQQVARSLEWPAPNTISAFSAAFLILTAGLPVLMRLALHTPRTGEPQGLGSA
ncbi:hypothetical protein GCM10009847_05000 [Leucobacter tardus]|uniref:Uncharacterized protein n=1 Tax=Leucobacter tardus TaxID=501483 RepID=A0A939TJ02_9MICO|nr:hypothetical protein [Leucobacter tardus]MBO2988706.1 hypothetical protein [Leucobacter tardus]